MNIRKLVDVEKNKRIYIEKYQRLGRLEVYVTADGYKAFDENELEKMPLKKRGRKIKRKVKEG